MDPLKDLREWLIKQTKEFLVQELNYLLYYESNISDLKKEVDNLKQEQQILHDRVKDEEDRHGREIYDFVSKWFDQAEAIKDEYDKFLKEDDRANAKCFAGAPIDLLARHSLSKRSVQLKEKARSQSQRAAKDFDIISHNRGPASVVLALSNVDYQSLPSRKTAMEDITNALRDSNARTIGVHGPSGVGKTTLVMEVVNRVQNSDQETSSKLFDVVVMANVTKTPDIRKIQDQIADMLSMKLAEESEEGRAGRIRERLEKQKENTLIILDDVSAKVDLNILGIPRQSGYDNLKNPKGEKSLGSMASEQKETKQQVDELGGMEYQKSTEEKAIQLGVLLSGETKTKKAPDSSSLASTKGCKVLVISEVRQVLNQMDVRPDVVVSVNLLDEKDARALFYKMAEIGDKSPELGDLPAQIVKKCDGLPLSIVSIAKKLRNQSRLVWKDTHQKLEMQTLAGTPEHSTRLIYDLLENEELKITFLLCACMGNDALVSDLVRLCIGLGFLRGIYTVRDTRSRVQVMLMKLRESGLLSKSYSSDRFTMQNLVRNAALSIASKERHMLMLTKEKLEEWPDNEDLRRYVAISLRHCDVIDAITKSMKCYKLKILEVNNDDPYLKLPNGYFKQMKELKVLILTGVQLSLKGSSIGCLTKLRMLCLEHCTLIPSSSEKSASKEELRVIENLKNLRILSFSGSNIDCLPVELKNLCKLQTLDISNCPKLSLIPSEVIPHLTSLEELYMRNTPIQWTKVNRGENNQSENAGLSELGELNQLTNLDIQIESVDQLPKNLFFDKLSSYKIVIGSLDTYLERDFKMPEKRELSRFLAIHQKGGTYIHYHKGIKMLFERVEHLLLGKLIGVKDIFYELNLKGFPHLRDLTIRNNHEINFLVNPKDRQQHQEKFFEKLETLELYKVTQIKEICSSSCVLSDSSFVNLKTIKIKLCGQLKNLFFTSMLKHLAALETIQASDCDSLKEIVHAVNNEETETLEFPKLRTLTLESLPEFSGFGPIPATPGSDKILFDQMVKVSELERMELRWIQIDQIWDDQSSKFEKLIHLDVNGCHNLKYLFPSSLATNLKKLQSLYVSECYQMKNIFLVPDGSEKVAKDASFPNLKNIKLSRMSRLEKIWNLNVPVGKLETLVIEKCNQLVSVFHHDMEGIFQGVSSLVVANCKSMETIFDLAADKNGNPFETMLRDVHLESLPELKSILKWDNQEQGRKFQLESLMNIMVHDCRKLDNIFPFSVATQLKKLQCILVSDCYKLKEIVAVEPTGTSDNNGSWASNPLRLEFTQLTTIKFSKLPNLESFYKGQYELKCESLDDVSVEFCDNLKLFGQDASQATSSQVKPLLHEKEAMNKLRSMHIELQHANSSTCYRRDKLEVLHLSQLEDTKILYDFLCSNPYLKSLWLDNCKFEKLVEPENESSFDAIDEIENIGVVPNLKTLKLTNLSCLKEIGFEHDAILQRIESLILENCPKLETIVSSKESVHFNFLTNLEVVDCNFIKYLMPLSIAESLGQLVTMKVARCESLEEIIIVSDHQGGEECKREPRIVFKQMKALELVCLKNLERFCSSKRCTVEFPVLEKFVVSVCPKMDKFSETEAKTTPTIMQKVYVVHDEEKRLCWQGDLRATIRHIYTEKKYFEGMDKISVSEHLVIEEGWKTGKALDKGWFYSVKTLTLEGCKFESCAIPWFVLRCLKSLKELEVRNCKKITSIFEMKDIKGRFQLEKLTLEELPNVTHVWPQQDKQKDRRFQNLQQVVVKSCRKLKALFPVAIAITLKILEQLEVHSCDELLEIVQKDRGGGEGKKSFVFPYLTQLELHNLPQLTRFYDGEFTLECPELNNLYPFYCNKFELFQKPQESSPSNIRRALFSNIKDIYKVATMYMRSKDTSVLNLWLQKSRELELEYLTGLMLAFHDDVKNEYSTLPFEILVRTPKLQRLAISNSTSLDKILFRSQNPKFLEHLKYLALHSLFGLSSIGGIEYLENLQELIVWQCPLLRTIEKYPPSLKTLNVEGCHGLQCLFTSSAVRTLKHLQVFYVDDCKSLKDIVRDDETDTEEINFEKLIFISLRFLESLECFYEGNAALRFPSLGRVLIWRCPKMTIFSQQLRDEDPSRKIQLSVYNKDKGNCTLSQTTVLNIVLESQFLYQEYLFLSDYPEIQGKWVSPSGIPVDKSFFFIKALVVEDCEFLTNAVLPSHLLPLLSNLEEMAVRKCKNVRAIFDVKDTSPEHDKNNVTIHLRKIILEKLPTLTHVWNDDPKASLSIPSLEKVSVKKCKSVKSLFPASVPTDNLQYLYVRKCGELKEIVAKDEAVSQEDIILFPKLTMLVLRDLPNLRRICSGIHSLLDCCDDLIKRLYIYRCRMLKVFAADIQNSNPGGEGCFATDDDKHNFVSSAQKVITFNFEELELSKEEVTMIQNKVLKVDFQNLNYLGLNNFNDDESDEFLLDDFLSNVSLPKLKEIQMVDCAFKDIFRPKESGIDYSKMLSQLNLLEITNIHKLNSMGFEQPWMAPLLQNLETLKISECNLLTNLASSSAVSFFCLTVLRVDNCEGLKYLFTSSTAKSLGALQKLSISKCKSLTTVVAHEEGDKPEDMVLFSKLYTLSLNKLPRLESFYTGNSTLYFPKMHSARVSFTITKCNNMKTFSLGDVLPEFLQGKIDEDRCYGDLNTIVHKQFEKATSPHMTSTSKELLPTERSDVAFIETSPEC